MARAERTGGAVSLEAAWGSFGRHLAVSCGALVALASLIADAPVSVASLRGGAACLALVALTRAGEWVGARTFTPPAPTGAEAEAGEEAPEATR